MSHDFQNRVHSPNHLLSSLSLDDYVRIAPHLHTVKLALGDVVGHASCGLGFAYFPTTSVVSLLCDMENGATTEVALTGNDGVLGTSIFLGGNTTTNRAVVGIAGEAVRMDAKILRDQFTQGGASTGTLALHQCSHQPDLSHCRVQPQAHSRKTTLPLVAFGSRPRRI